MVGIASGRGFLAVVRFNHCGPDGHNYSQRGAYAARRPLPDLWCSPELAEQVKTACAERELSFAAFSRLALKEKLAREAQLRGD